MIASHSGFAEETTNPDVVFAKTDQFYQSGNYKEAFQELQRIAATGNAQAIYNLGSMTMQGKGTPKDEKKALQYFQQASDKGFGKASFELAQLYRHGKSSVGITKNTEQYKKFLDLAAKQGSEEAGVEIATLFFAQGQPKYDQLAIQQLRPLIQKGYYPAIHIKALYDLGVGVKNKNPVMQQQAVRKFKSLGESGYAPSLMILANLMANGEIVDQNLPEAQKIYTTLAAQDFPNSKEALVEVERAMAEQKATQTTKK